ncbi:hypothetical protein [Aureitalea marina]|uniref:Glycerophosphoryl diester phosphodiesterase membrane domain-containing protein n=1 Tax=Aureitalea marina TaxID=930804 RepID=A0A2S7KLU1_9FLAO|nr:hypothetical protein [Aureitalea marina]PQB03595.1 hypothetical protein BST85_00785 [Aureitalea marina]
MELVNASLSDRIEQAKSVDFGAILGGSFEFFGKVWIQGFYHALISAALVILIAPLIYIPLIPFFVEAFDGYEYAVGDDLGSTFFQGFTLIYWIGYGFLVFVLSIFMQAINFAVISHYYRVMRKIDDEQAEDAGGYLDDIKVNFRKLMLLSLTTTAIALLAGLLCYLPLLYVIVPIQLLIPLYAFNRDASASELINSSFKLGNKYWLTVFGLIIISQFLAQLGVILCVIGLFFTVNFVHVPIYLFYRDSVGFDQE